MVIGINATFSSSLTVVALYVCVTVTVIKHVSIIRKLHSLTKTFMKQFDCYGYLLYG